MSVSGVAKFLLGFVIAIALLVGSGVAVALYFVTKLTALPPKPIFSNERIAAKPKPVPAVRKPVTTAASPATAPSAASEARANEPSAAPTPSETPTQKPLEPGAYRARVTWENGLSLRDSADPDSERIGGVAYNQKVVVLAESDDKRWVKVRLEDSNEEGWVKSGNLEKLDEAPTETARQ